MAPRDRKNIKKALLKKGFKQVPGDHQRFKLIVDGHLAGISTMLSRGSGYKIYNDELLAKMSLQLKLSKVDLRRFIDCPMTAKEYLQKLREHGHLRDTK
ncbi:MAG: hypothetical protein ACC655_03875 [Rhodothermia bacterium]